MDEKWLQSCVADGLSLEGIGRLADRHPSTVAYWLGKYGLSAPGREKHAARGEIGREELEALVESGASIGEIGERLGRGTRSVRHWLGRYGLETVATTRRRRARIAVEHAGARVSLARSKRVSSELARALQVPALPRRGCNAAAPKGEGVTRRRSGWRLRDLRLRSLRRRAPVPSCRPVNQAIRAQRRRFRAVARACTSRGQQVHPALLELPR